MAHQERRRRQPDGDVGDELCLPEGSERVCDTNNNSGAPLTMGGTSTGRSASRNRSTLEKAGSAARVASKSREVVAEASGRDNQRRQLNTGAGRRSESNASESDDWHLLDVDGQSESSVSSVSSYQEFASNNTPRVDPKRRHLKRREQVAMTQEADAANMFKRTSVNSSTSNNNNNNNNYQHDDEKSNSKYIEVEPADRDHLSPRLIYVCAALYSLLPLASLLTFVTLFILIFTKYWLVTIVYYSYLVFDAKTCNRGGRRWPSAYKARFWSYLAAYFPIKLRFSNRFHLDPNENYILNYHPHGISAFGCVASFATDGLKFSRLFPGVRPRFMVHETSFLVPIMRETFMTRGDCSVNSKSFDYILEKRWQTMADSVGGSSSQREACGNLLALCGGGLAEADLSDMETLKIVCASRKGFVKKALIHGAHLIPCIAFGENSVFKKVNLKPGTFLYKLEKRWYDLFKFKHPIYYGESMLFGGLIKGSMPYKRPITVVMGDPIQVERVSDPSQKEIDDLHSLYIHRLKSMYEDNKESLCRTYDTKLKLV